MDLPDHSPCLRLNLRPKEAGNFNSLGGLLATGRTFQGKPDFRQGVRQGHPFADLLDIGRGPLGTALRTGVAALNEAERSRDGILLSRSLSEIAAARHAKRLAL